MLQSSYPAGRGGGSNRGGSHGRPSTAAALCDQLGIGFAAGWVDTAERVIACASHDPAAGLELVRAGGLCDADFPVPQLPDALAAVLALAGRDDAPAEPRARARLIADVARAAFGCDFTRPDGVNDLERILLLELSAAAMERFAAMLRGAARIASAVRQRAREALDFAADRLGTTCSDWMAAGLAPQPADAGGRA